MFWTLFALQKKFVDFSSDLPGNFALRHGGFWWFFQVSVSHERKHENSSKIGDRSNIRGTIRDENSKNSVTFRSTQLLWRELFEQPQGSLVIRIETTSNRKSLATAIATQKNHCDSENTLRHCDFTAISAGKACDFEICDWQSLAICDYDCVGHNRKGLGDPGKVPGTSRGQSLVSQSRFSKVGNRPSICGPNFLTPTPLPGRTPQQGPKESPQKGYCPHRNDYNLNSWQNKKCNCKCNFYKINSLGIPRCNCNRRAFPRNCYISRESIRLGIKKCNFNCNLQKINSRKQK